MLKPDAETTTKLLDIFRAPMLSHLLVIGTTSYNVPMLLSDQKKSYDEIKEHFQLADRALNVLLTAWRAMGLIEITYNHKIMLTEDALEKLSSGSQFDLSGYLGLGAFSPDVQKLAMCLKEDKPQGEISFVYHEGDKSSALDNPEISDMLTRAMAGRAKNVAPYVAEKLDLSKSNQLIDVGGAHGIYTLELLKKHPQLRATIIDREAPLKVAREYAEQAHLLDRVRLEFGDIFTYQSKEKADVILLANILHDYHEQDAQSITTHFAKQLAADGRIIILDAFLDSVGKDDPPVSPGPMEVAAYSAMLFSICEGRCYRLDEYQKMLETAGLTVDSMVHEVPAHGKLLTGWKK